MKKKNNDLKLIMVKQSILKDEVEKLSKDEQKLKNQIKYQTLLKKLLSFMKKFIQDMD